MTKASVSRPVRRINVPAARGSSEGCRMYDVTGFVLGIVIGVLLCAGLMVLGAAVLRDA